MITEEKVKEIAKKVYPLVKEEMIAHISKGVSERMKGEDINKDVEKNFYKQLVSFTKFQLKEHTENDEEALEFLIYGFLTSLTLELIEILKNPMEALIKMSKGEK